MEKYVKGSKVSYALGMSLSIEALKKRPGSVKEILLSSKCHKNRQFEQLENLCHLHHVPMKIDDAAIASLSLKENCYAIALFEIFASSIQEGDHLALVDFESFGDLGTILRSAVSFDYHEVALIGKHPDIFDPRCIRASMGALFHLNFSEFPDVSSYVKAYPDHALYPFISHGDAFEKLPFRSPYTLFFSEDYHGLESVFEKGYTLPHRHFEDIPLSSLSSIVLSEGYYRKCSR